MSKIRKWLHQFWGMIGHRCMGCGTLLEGSQQFCYRCSLDYIAARERECGACGRVLSLCTCAPQTLREKRVRKLYKLLPYRPQLRDNGANEMIFRIKRKFATTAMRFCAEELAKALLAQLPKDKKFLVTFAPRTPRACRKYGYDHGELLSQMLAKELGFPWEKVLLRKNGIEQKRLVGAQRKANVEKAFLPRPLAEVKDLEILLFDDLVTTGSTMAAAAEVLYRMGAAKVVGVCLYASTRR